MSVFARGNTALITGGASGVGFAVAQLCRRHGMRVAVVDMNAEHLAQARETLSKDGSASDIATFEADVSKQEQWDDIKGRFEKEVGGGAPPDLLMLNAGVGAKGTWGDASYFHKILDTNLWGVINGANAFVPALAAGETKKPRAIVITGSKQGITNPPGNVAYNMSKSAVKTLAEHLSFDLRETGTSVHLLVPGWTFTGLTGGGGPGSRKEKPEGAWAPEQVAGYLEKKMGEGKFYVICPDNDVNEEKDKKRMLWGVGDIVSERPPLSRWRDEFKDEHEEWMSKQKV